MLHRRCTNAATAGFIGPFSTSAASAAPAASAALTGNKYVGHLPAVVTVCATINGMDTGAGANAGAQAAAAAAETATAAGAEAPAAASRRAFFGASTDTVTKLRRITSMHCSMRMRCLLSTSASTSASASTPSTPDADEATYAASAPAFAITSSVARIGPATETVADTDMLCDVVKWVVAGVGVHGCMDSANVRRTFGEHSAIIQRSFSEHSVKHACVNIAFFSVEVSHSRTIFCPCFHSCGVGKIKIVARFGLKTSVFAHECCVVLLLGVTKSKGLGLSVYGAGSQGWTTTGAWLLSTQSISRAALQESPGIYTPLRHDSFKAYGTWL
jgi:hypothetical protein